MIEINPIPKLAIVGAGNVGAHLSEEFFRNSVHVRLVNSRTLEGLSSEFDFIILCVSDSAISSVAENIAKKLPDFNGIVAHSAGSVPIDVLAPFFNYFGVFYPLQTFSRNIEFANFRNIPVFIEGSDDEVLASLESLAHKIVDKVYRLSSPLREKLHLASVFACNFSNAMYSIADEILQDINLPFSVAHSLILQTAEKAVSKDPVECQTGPARRDDKMILAKHLELLKDHPARHAIYKDVSDYITEKYHE